MGDIIEFPIRPPAEGWEALEACIRQGLEQAQTPPHLTEVALAHVRDAWTEARERMTGTTITQPDVRLTLGDPARLRAEVQELTQRAVDATAEHCQHETIAIVALLCARIAAAYASA